jgi:hypothetical protein
VVKDERTGFTCGISSFVFVATPIIYCCFFLSLQFQSAFESKEAYYKDIGHREDGGKLESVKDYLKRLESYMKLYGALVQVCHSLFLIIKKEFSLYY